MNGSIKNGTILSLELLGVKVPPILVERYLKDRAESDERFDFSEWWYDQENDTEYEGKLVDEEIAEFIVELRTSQVPSGGGHSIDSRIEFEDNGTIYTIIAYGWTSLCEDSKGELGLIGFKRNRESATN